MIFARNKEVSTQAFTAAKEGDFDTLKTMVRFNFNLEDCDEQGNCALHYAVQGDQLEIVKYLVEKGGLDPTWSNLEMITPYDLAHNMGLLEIEKYFEEWCGFAYEEAYHNPIRRSMYPDPSIVRVGDDYYMVNSTFVFFPGIPISHSKDLVHWEVIGHAVTDAAWAEEYMGHLEGGRGFWAPDISYHNGRFYVTATLRMNDDVECIQTQMVTSSERPEGPYETPVVHYCRGIDPSIFTDDDGRRYMLLNRGAQIIELSEDGKEMLSEPELIWYGTNKHGPEGPHILKKDGWYYCFLAEGGTGKGHMITVARSKNLYGPYEECPYNPIMTQKDSAGVLQCCGHGKPVQTADGRWFIVYLCSRLIDDKWGMLGRETCLDEIVWTPDGWPVVNRGKGPSYMRKAPLESYPVTYVSPWMGVRTINPQQIQIADKKVTITGNDYDLCTKECRSILVKRQPDFKFDAEFTMELPENNAAYDAGMVLYYDENTYVKFGIADSGVVVKEYIDDKYVRTVEKAVAKKNNYHFRIETDNLTRRFILDGEEVACLEEVTCLCSEGLRKGKRFTGATYGVYVYGKETVVFTEC